MTAPAGITPPSAVGGKRQESGEEMMEMDLDVGDLTLPLGSVVGACEEGRSSAQPTR